jgi:hypothetical protein
VSRVTPESASLLPQDPDRLDGWKEIAAYLGRSVRSVQRWEEAIDLPIQRKGSTGGEIVFAFRSEIDRWLKAGSADGQAADQPGEGEVEVPTPVPGEVTGEEPDYPVAPHAHSRWLPALLAASAIAAAAASLGLAYYWKPTDQASPYEPGSGAAVQPVLQTAPADRQPARWGVVDGGLSILSFDKDPICTVPFPEPIAIHAYEVQPEHRRLAVDLRAGPDLSGGQSFVEIADFDGDGRREIAVGWKTTDVRRQSTALYDDRCREKWRRTLVPSVMFGGARYDTAFHVLWVSAAKNPGAGWSLWVSRRHDTDFPSVAYKYDAAGNLLTQIWHAGEIKTVVEGLVGGRQSILIGGVNNEFKVPFVAKYDRSLRVGVGPASASLYRCESCPASAALPRAYALFPDSEMPTVDGGMRTAEVIRLDHQWIRVDIPQYGLEDRLPPIYASTSYDLDPNLIPVSADFSDQYKFVWAELFRRGIVNRPFSPVQREGLWNLRLWNGSAFRVFDYRAQRAH